MGDWDFLYEMNERGYSADQIADAAGCGMAPWEELAVDWDESDLEREPDESVASSAPYQSRSGYPSNYREQTEIFEGLVELAERHFENTGRYLQIWGELGEIFAEIHFGLRRHATHHAGSDGIIDGRRVEVKTISPEKLNARVTVKRQGDFEQLLIIRISRDFEFEGRMFERAQLNGQNAKVLRRSFDD